MRSSIWSLVLAGVLVWCASDVWAQPEAQRSKVTRHALTPGGVVRVAITGGAVRVRGDDVERATLRITRNGEHWARLAVSVEARAGGLQVRVSQPGHTRADVTVELTLPRSVKALHCRATSGVVSVTGMRTALSIETISGPIRCERIVGDLAAESVSGSISLTDVRSQTISLQTVSGAMAGEVHARALTAKAIGGALRILLTPPRKGDWRVAAESIGGPMHIALPDGVGAAVKASAMTGSIACDFTADKAVRSPTGSRLDAHFGDGRGAIALQTISGAVRLARATEGRPGGVWRLRLTPWTSHKRWGLDKLTIGDQLVYFFGFELTNPGPKPIETNLQLYLMTDRLRAGVDPSAARAWNSFRSWRLPAAPAEEDATFDNTPKWHMQKRHYDRPNRKVWGGVVSMLGRGWRHAVHTSEIGRIAPGATIKAAAVFTNVDPHMDFAGVVVKNLANRIRTIGERTFLEDRVSIYRYHSPGSAAHAAVNPIIPRRPAVRAVIMRSEVK